MADGDRDRDRDGGGATRSTDSRLYGRPVTESPRGRDEIMWERPVYAISVAAELAAMHPQTLRTYERRGLVHPLRLANNRRLYSPQDVEKLRRIQQLTDTGLNLAGVERVLALEALVDHLETEMDGLRNELERAAVHLRDEVKRVERSHRRDLVPVRTRAMVSLRPPAGRRPRE
jgi:MerR family transcriptional regulator/heat shock protein HspR